MAITRVTGTGAAPGSAAAFALTAGSFGTHAVGDFLLLNVTGKYDTATIPTINQGWTLIKSGTGGTGTAANDAGTMFTAVYGKYATSTSETMPTVTPGGTAPNSWAWHVQVFRSTLGWGMGPMIADVPWTQILSDTSTASPLTATSAVFPTSVAVGTYLAVSYGIPTDLGTAGNTSSATATGASITVAANLGYVENALGTDMAIWGSFLSLLSGPATSGITYSSTITGASNHSGIIAMTHIYEVFRRPNIVRTSNPAISRSHTR